MSQKEVQAEISIKTNAHGGNSATEITVHEEDGAYIVRLYRNDGTTVLADIGEWEADSLETAVVLAAELATAELEKQFGVVVLFSKADQARRRRDHTERVVDRQLAMEEHTADMAAEQDRKKSE